jgi:YVTN family beta-propeller protein
VSAFGRLVVMVVCVALAGCAVPLPAATPLIPVVDLDQPFVFDGFSVLPPRGPNWFVAPPEAAEDNQVLVLGKLVRDTPPSTPAESRTVAAIAMLWDLRDTGPRSASELQRWSEQSRVLPGQRLSARHRLLTSSAEVEPALGATCVRYALSTEDEQVPRFPGSVFILSARGVRCLHPRWPRYAVDLSYSERYLRGLPPLAFDAEAESFFRSLRFTAERPIAASIIPIGNDPAGVAAGAGAAWVAQMGADAVRRIDVGTNEPAGEPIAVGRQPAGMAFGHGALWVTNRGSNTVSRIDPVTNRVIATVAVGTEPRQVAAGATGVWVANFEGETVTRIDPRSNQGVATVRVGKWPGGLAEGPGAIWVAVRHEHSLVRIDPVTHRIAARIPLGVPLHGVAVGEDAVWVAGGEGTAAVVARIDPRSNTVSARIPVDGVLGGVAVNPAGVWVSNFSSGSVWRIDPRSNTVAGKPLPVGKGPVWITIGEGAVWVSNRRSGTVARIDLP